MRIGLHDAEKDYLKDKTFPNLALMKISAWHKQQGDTVEWWIPSNNHTKTDRYDMVYSSKVFDFTPVNPYLPDDAIRGGTGYQDVPIGKELPKEVDDIFPDYSIYPDCDYAIGYITRGCPNKCPWCGVPAKEGAIRPYWEWERIVRPDTKKVVLMDNNILACEYGVRQLEDMIGSGYKIDLNQGMDARLVTEDIARILAALDWIRHIRFSCDQRSQIEPINNVVRMLEKYGVRPYRLYIYLLVREDIEDAAYRVDALKRHTGINIYAQAERNERQGIQPNEVQLEFAQRYIYSGKYRKETWPEYCERKKLESQAGSVVIPGQMNLMDIIAQ